MPFSFMTQAPDPDGFGIAVPMSRAEIESLDRPTLPDRVSVFVRCDAEPSRRMTAYRVRTGGWFVPFVTVPRDEAVRVWTP